MDDIKERLLKQKINLDNYNKDNKFESKIDIYKLRDIVVEIIKNTEFLNEIKKANERIFIKKDQFLEDVLKNKGDYVERTLYGNEEEIKVALVTLIDQLAHIENNTEFKKDSLNLALEKSANKKYTYSKENIYQELKSKSDEWYDKKKSSDDVKKLKNLYEDSGIRKDDENIKNQKLLDFDEALDFCEIEDVLFDIKEMVMVECFKDKRINKTLYINEEIKHGNKKYLRIAFNTDKEYMLTMAHIEKETYLNLAGKFKKYIQKVKNIPRELSTSFPIILDEEDWKLENNYVNDDSNYKTKYRHIKNNFEKYDIPFEKKEEELDDY